MVWYEDSTIVSAIIVGIPTAILTVITFFYMWETRKIRQSTQRPNFALEPTLYSIGGEFHRLALINTGQTATDLQIDVSWENTGQEKLKLYAISLSRDGAIYLDKIPLAEIKKEQKNICVNIKCKDMSGEKFESKLIIDFSSIINDGREVAFQYDKDRHLTNSIDGISRAISSIERALNQISNSIRNRR